MNIIADLHLHSRYARAVSKSLNIAELDVWGKKKGNHLIAAPDMFHPAWRAEMEAELEPVGNGFYKRKGSDGMIQFILSAEISCIYNRDGKTRRVHAVIHAPDFAAVEKISAPLSWVGKLASDGRPIIGMDVQELCKIVFNASPRAILYPAHIWTPWFSLFGSKSGFDRFTDCFGPYSDQVTAVETGLSSDPAMNWRLSQLDNKQIISGSDAHSSRNMGREATVFSFTELSYDNLRAALSGTDAKNRIIETIEFFPEEGMYHWDGHRNCNVRWSPAETREHDGVCPKCGMKVTVGVESRVEELADRPAGEKPANRPPFRSLIPLSEVIAEIIGTGKLTKGVQRVYEDLIARGGDEFTILLQTPIEDIRAMTPDKPRIADAIERMRNHQLRITPGYDGTYGIVKVFDETEEAPKTGQQSLI